MVIEPVRSVTFVDERAMKDIDATTVDIGDSFDGEPVFRIEVEFPLGRPARLYLTHRETVTVLPEVKIVSYRIDRT